MIMLRTPKYVLGADLGTASVKLVVLDDYERIAHNAYSPHRGDVLGTFRKMLDETCRLFNAAQIARCGVCGAFSHLLDVSRARRVDEIAALSEGVLHLYPHAACVMDIGGQSAKFLAGPQCGEPPLHFSMNGNCAAGTGAFFEDQMSRLGLALEDYSSLAGAAAATPRIAGRCSVFAKTDIIHHQQEGAPAADILLGLAYAVARNYKAAIVKKLPVAPPVVLAGGTAYNTALVRAIRDVFDLRDDDLLVDASPACFAALGAALTAMHRGAPTGLPIDGRIAPAAGAKRQARLPRLPQVIPDTTGLHKCAPVRHGASCALGIDIGSTSTNLVLLDEDNQVVDYQYLRTRGNPEQAVRDGLDSIRRRFGETIVIGAVGATGSGRHMIGRMVGADAVRDEITAQATAALAHDPLVDTIFEIGGQDSKYIHCRDGRVDDFQMNRICAAGTGSFLEEQTARLGMSLAEIGDNAMQARSPVDLGERCTVFIETNIAARLAEGVDRNDVVAGLCLSVVRNYLTKVVGQKPVGQRIRLQGGVAFNPGIVAAFRQALGDRLDVTPFFGVTGAVGAALLAREAVGEGKTMFAGFDMAGNGGEDAHRAAAIARNAETYSKSGALLTEDYSGAVEPGRKTVGIPRVLLMHKLFPLFHNFFKHLGYNVLLSEPTGETTISASQDAAREETCYPVKLIHGHMLELAGRGVDFIFMPRLITMRHETSMVRHNYGCVYMQSAPRLIANAIDLEKRGIELLDPILSLDFGEKELSRKLSAVGRRLGHDNDACRAAVMRGAEALRRFTTEVEKIGAAALASLKPDEIALVMITRNYGLADPALNMGIAKTALGMGYKALTLSHLPAHDMSLAADYPNLYWPFGQHILAGAKIIRQHPNLYAIYLTNHGCGPDTMLSHLFRQEMGDKPYLAIEVDEHDSNVGVVTRVEAFINSLKGAHKPATAKPIRDYLTATPHRRVDILTSLPEPERGGELAIPWLYPYSQILCETLRARGHGAVPLPPTGGGSLSAGRAKTASKEYLSFTALVGNVLAYAERRPDATFLIPQTEGAEADGHYARVIRAMLDDAGKAGCGIVAPIAETLWQDAALGQAFFASALAGDILLSAPPRRRAELLRDMLAAIAQSGGPAETHLLRWAKTVAAGASNTSGLLVTGEPAILFDSLLNNGVIDRLERRGNHIRHAPLSEYLYFLWSERAGTGNLIEYEASMMAVRETLGGAGGFSSSIEALRTLADRALPSFAGANGRYRCAKLLDAPHGVSGILSISSMYENTATILGMLDLRPRLPVLNLTFDGNAGYQDELRLSSFLRRAELPSAFAAPDRQQLVGDRGEWH